nr:MAG TPA: hypothetical protein [Caudoviricetes sp.]
MVVNYVGEGAHMILNFCRLLYQIFCTLILSIYSFALFK